MFDLHHLAAFTSLWVAVVYLVIGGMIVPNLRFPVWATVLAIAFFVGCAFTHAHIAADMFAPHNHIETVIPPLDSAIMTVLHVIQGIGGTGFIIAMARKRLIVRMED